MAILPLGTVDLIYKGYMQGVGARVKTLSCPLI